MLLVTNLAFSNAVVLVLEQSWGKSTTLQDNPFKLPFYPLYTFRQGFLVRLSAFYSLCVCETHTHSEPALILTVPPVLNIALFTKMGKYDLHNFSCFQNQDGQLKLTFF